MKRISKVEKFLIAEIDDNYTTYRCDEHGVYQIRKDVNNSQCPYCKKKYEPLKNFKELQAKFKTELGL